MNTLLGGRIKALRSAKNYTQEQMADRIGVSWQKYARIESGVNSIIDYVIYNYNHKAIPKETLEKVLECYHLSLEDISDRIDIMTDDNDDLVDLIGELEDWEPLWTPM